MSKFRLVGISGNTHRPSKSQILLGTILESLRIEPGVSTTVFDIIDAGPGLGGAYQRDHLPPEAARIVEAIENADGLIVAVPIYKASYPGLFKHLIDFVDPLKLAGKPVALAATGGGTRHALSIEHQLRPLFGFFSALTLPTGVFVSDANYAEGKIVDSDSLTRIDALAAEFKNVLRTRSNARSIEEKAAVVV
ncbi:NAD(P)H-dependent oxidoreductase [Methylocystis parvus]|uniref:FMN reductase n=1 Tax=Methylocystis parvus TaxID=134 RepID=A0A6B8M1A0_9HYPH|nr:NAD(P)H-dependent oxidoreductase [Methylocystis parvus]QGM97574.1 FMN reductase [Methylocystis parvus]WBJ98494.1 NAD(P)H-dependent oxidoreductase [Methylocystis parvus OBBP]